MSRDDEAKALGVTVRTLYRRRIKGDMTPGRHKPRPPVHRGPVADYLESVLGTDIRTEWCRRLGVSRNTVCRWERASEVPECVRRRVASHVSG